MSFWQDYQGGEIMEKRISIRLNLCDKKNSDLFDILRSYKLRGYSTMTKYIVESLQEHLLNEGKHDAENFVTRKEFEEFKETLSMKTPVESSKDEELNEAALNLISNWTE